MHYIDGPNNLRKLYCLNKTHCVFNIFQLSTGLIMLLNLFLS